MPSCVVKGCTNNSSKNKKQDGITFHTFPIRNKNIREKWIEVIRANRVEPSWNPTICSLVCSTHFEHDDFYITNKGLRRVVRNGYPKLVATTPIKSIDVYPIITCSSPDHVTATQVFEHVSATQVSQHVSATQVFQHVSATQVLPSITPNEQEDSESIYDTHQLRKLIIRLKNKQKQMKTLISTLYQQVRRLKQRNNSFKEIFKNLKKQNYVDTDLYNSLDGNMVVLDIFSALNRKKLKKNIKYTPAMKNFCLTLNSYSPKAYEYVRCTFNTCLPHQKTLAKW